MIRGVIAGVAACALISGAAFAKDYQDAPPPADQGVVVHHDPDPGEHALKGGAAGAGVGAAIGCIVTIAIGCGPGAAVGAAVGGGTGAVAGAASTPPPHDTYYPPRD